MDGLHARRTVEVPMDGTAVTERLELPELRERLRDADLEALRAAVAERVHRAGVTFGPRPFTVDPVPRVIAAAEWEELRAGIVQRVRALEAFVADVYGPRQIVKSGVVPERVLAGADHYEPELAGLRPPGGWIGVAGLDLLRGPDGRFAVVEDNLRTPSGAAYLLAARDAVDAALGWAPPQRAEVREAVLDGLRATLRAAAPDGVEQPFAVLLTDGPSNPAHWEHRVLTEALPVEEVRLDDLQVRGERLYAHARPVDVVYRRTDDDRLRDCLGALTPVGELVLGPWRAGTLGLVNAYGTGVADDKVAHAYVEDMVRFYLDEAPVLRSVGTYDLGDEAACAQALDRLDELVIKPRGGYGGRGVVVGPRAQPAERERVSRALREDPEGHVAQETVWFSRHPTIVDGRLELRHVDLRPFAYRAGDEIHVVPGGLTRVAFAEDELVVNSSRGGGAKDTWVLQP
jgi:carboxylate-amine ligase